MERRRNGKPQRMRRRTRQSLVVAWLAAAAVSASLPCTSSSEREPRKNLREEEYSTPTTPLLLSSHRHWGRRREHEVRFLTEAGKKRWSRRRDDGGKEFPVMPTFSSPTNQFTHDSNPRSRNLGGKDSFHMIGTSIADPDYGIGSNNSSRQNRPTSQKTPAVPPEHPRNHKGSKSVKAQNGKGGAPTRPPSNRPPSRPPSSVQPPSFVPPNDDKCNDPITLQFLQFSAVPPAILVFPEDPNVQDIGTRYIYNSDLRDAQTLDELVGSRSNGVCTRTQARIQEISGAVYQLGGGHCQFTYTFHDGDRQFTLEASGTVVDSMGGTISITGGTKDAIGAYGEMTLSPVNLTPDGEFEREMDDFFLDPLFYLVDAVVFVPC